MTVPEPYVVNIASSRTHAREGLDMSNHKALRTHHQVYDQLGLGSVGAASEPK